MDTENRLLLIQKYLDGSASDEEKTILDNWYRESTDKPVYWDIERENEDIIIKQRIWQNIQKRTQPQNRWKQHAKFWLKAAACICAVGFAVAYIIRVNYRGNTTYVNMQTITKGVKKQNRYIILPDSSVVILGTGSQIAFSQNGDSREIVLEGEAFFDIRHNKSLPFFIRSSGYTIKVLGTAFNVRSRNDSMQVSVTRGSVSVADIKQKVIAILSEGQEIQYAAKSDPQVTKKFDEKKELAWISSDMEFENISLEKLTAQLAYRYGKIFHFEKESSKNLLISGKFNETEPIEEVIRVLSKTTSLEFSIKGENIYIRDGGK